MSDETKRHLTDQQTAHREFAERVLAALDKGEQYTESDDEDADEYGTDPYDRLSEYPLCIDVTRRVTIVLGTGGPHTELVADLDRDGDLTAVQWNGYWGGDKIERSISHTDPLWRLAEYYAEYVADAE